jgi:hypothetical protein
VTSKTRVSINSSTSVDKAVSNTPKESRRMGVP